MSLFSTFKWLYFLFFSKIKTKFELFKKHELVFLIPVAHILKSQLRKKYLDGIVS